MPKEVKQQSNFQKPKNYEIESLQDTEFRTVFENFSLRQIVFHIPIDSQSTGNTLQNLTILSYFLRFCTVSNLEIDQIHKVRKKRQ